MNVPTPKPGRIPLSGAIVAAATATAIGLTLEETWTSLASGHSGVRLLPDYVYRGAGVPVGLCDLERVRS
jgi:hypothetical protein